MLINRQSLGQYHYDRLIYYPTHARCGPWIIGLALGYVMYQNRDIRPKTNRHITRALWISAISVLFAVVLGYFPFQQAESYSEIPNIVNSVYNALFRSFWALAISWIIFACHCGSGGPVRWFLHLPCFVPLAKMSLSVYLTHRVYQIVTVAALKQPIYLDPFDLLHVYFGDVVMSLIIGAVVFLCIEAPFANIESRLFKRK